jgi:glycolate oxidase iron-sulfur subunit
LIYQQKHYKKPKVLQQQIAEKLLTTPQLHPLLKLSVSAIKPLLSLVNSKKKPSILTLINHFSDEMSEMSKEALKSFYPANPLEKTNHKSVILFKGCTHQLFDQQTLLDAIQLLNACQFDVLIPTKQQCCGAISVRQGNKVQNNAYAQYNIEHMMTDSNQPIIALNNSCSAHLQDYGKQSDGQDANQFSHQVTDILTFLALALKQNPIKFAPLTTNSESLSDPIGVHIPCSLKNVLKQEESLFTLLHYIPNIQLVTINDQYCCGAAGSYMLQYPEVAQQLLEIKIMDIKNYQYPIIVSSNIGCSLHLKQGLKKEFTNTELSNITILHPISLLAKQLIK